MGGLSMFLSPHGEKVDIWDECRAIEVEQSMDQMEIWRRGLTNRMSGEEDCSLRTKLNCSGDVHSWLRMMKRRVATAESTTWKWKTKPEEKSGNHDSSSFFLSKQVKTRMNDLQCLYFNTKEECLSIWWNSGDEDQRRAVIIFLPHSLYRSRWRREWMT